MLSRFLNRIYEIIDILNSLLLGTMVILIVVGVIFRYVLNNPLTGTEEITRYILIWIVFLGAAHVTEQEGHVRLEFFYNLLPLRARKILDKVFDIIIILFLLLVLKGSAVPLKSFVYIKTPTTQIPLLFVFIVVPLSALLMLLSKLKKLFVVGTR